MGKRKVFCQHCNHGVFRPQIHEMEFGMPAEARTALGRPFERTVVIRFWVCPRCEDFNSDSFCVPLDPDRPLLTAYEKRFGPANEDALAALAVFNRDAIAAFGEDWQYRYGDNVVKQLVFNLVELLMERHGTNWAKFLQNAEVSFLVEPLESESDNIDGMELTVHVQGV